MKEFETLVLVGGIEKLTVVEQRLIAEIYGYGVTPNRFYRDQKMTRKAYDASESKVLTTLKAMLAANGVCSVGEVM